MIVEFKVVLSDGTVLHAEGKHADVMVRFSNECQEICQTQGLAAYNGPPLTHYTAEEWAATNAYTPLTSNFGIYGDRFGCCRSARILGCTPLVEQGRGNPRRC